MRSTDDSASSRGPRDGAEARNTEHRLQVSQPLPIMRASAHKHAAHNDDDDDDDDDNDDDDYEVRDQGLFGPSPSFLFAVSTFSEWGTDSNTTDEGAESDPFCFDDEISRAIIHSKPVLATKERRDPSAAIVPSPLGAGVVVVQEEDAPLKTVVCVQANPVDCESGTVLIVVRSNSLLKRWAKAVWGAVTKIFGRRRHGSKEDAGGKGGKQS